MGSSSGAVSEEEWGGSRTTVVDSVAIELTDRVGESGRPEGDGALDLRL